MPVLVWGNGACSDDGTSAQNFLAQIASYGFIAISSGTPGGNGGSTTVEWMTEAVEWAVAGANGLNVDTSSIMAAGFSCGGTEAYEMQNNDAVSSIGIFNSGLLGDYEFASQISKPIMYALGGPDDIAYENVSLSLACSHIIPSSQILTLSTRASVTTPASPTLSPPGKATSTTSAMAAPTARQMVASSPKPLPTGCCGFTRATPRLVLTSLMALQLRTAGVMLSARTLTACLFLSLVVLVVLLLRVEALATLRCRSKVVRVRRRLLAAMLRLRLEVGRTLVAMLGFPRPPRAVMLLLLRMAREMMLSLRPTTTISLLLLSTVRISLSRAGGNESNLLALLD